MTTTIAPARRDSITLYFREGPSDKVYQVSIKPAGEGFVVQIAYGRRGSTLMAGAKTQMPVDYETAKRIFEKLVREKTAKGYTPGGDGTPFQHTAADPRVSGYLPQLLNSIEESEVPKYIRDPQWCLQEKFDGRRMLIARKGATVQGINRKGLCVGLPETVAAEILKIQDDIVLDGEAVDDHFIAFDVLELDGEDCRPKPLRERYPLLHHLLPSGNGPLRIAPTWTGETGKARALDILQSTEREGAVFKDLDAPYTSGRPTTGGSQVKFKFHKTLSAVVRELNQQRSVGLELLYPDGWRTCGNVGIPANHTVPPIGSVVEVRFLYAHRSSGCLFQPVYLGLRSDIDPADCLSFQLVFKSVDDES